MKIDLDQVKLLLDMVGETDISELTIEAEEERITIKKAPVGPPPPAHVGLPGSAEVSSGKQLVQVPAPSQSAHSEDLENKGGQNGLVSITAPMVGTFYRASSPTKPAFVEVGDTIKVGQTVCIIEAMKLMNDLPAEIAGRIVKICADNGATIEYGQQLFLIDPKG